MITTEDHEYQFRFSKQKMCICTNEKVKYIGHDKKKKDFKEFVKLLITRMESKLPESLENIRNIESNSMAPDRLE